MLQNQLKSHKVNGENSLFREKYLVGFSGPESGQDTKAEKMPQSQKELEKGFLALTRNDKELTEDNTTIEKAIFEFLNDKHDIDEKTAQQMAAFFTDKLKIQADYKDGIQKNRDIVVSNDGRTLKVSVHEESDWNDLEPTYKKTYFSGEVTAASESVQETIEKFAPSREVAVNTLNSQKERMQLAETTSGKTFFRSSEVFETEQTISQIEAKSISEDFYNIPEKFTDRFGNKNAAREAILTGQIEDYHNFVKLVDNLGINQRELLEETFGSNWSINLEQGVSAEKIFEFSKLGKQYKSLDNMQDKLKMLAKNPGNNRDELNIISRGLRDIRALGHMLEHLEYHAPTKKSPDYISEINFSNALDNKSKEAFKDNPEVLMALMGYLYGLDNMQKKQLVSYSLNKDNQYQAYIEKIPAEDFALLNEAYQKIDTLRWSFADNSLTEGIAELTKPEHAEIRALLDKAKLERAGQGTNAVKDLAALIANPLNTGPINEAYETLSYEEMQGEGATAKVSEFVNRQYSEKGIYETILRDSRDLDTNSYSLSKLEANLQRYAELGRLYLAQNPEALKNDKKLLSKEWPTNSGITNALGDRDLVKLIRYGFLLDQKIARATERQLNGLDADLAKAKINPQELAHFLAGVQFTPEQLTRLEVGAALVINFDEAGKPIQNSLHLGLGTNALDLKETAIVFAFTREDKEAGREASIGTAINPYTVNIGLSTKGKIDQENKYHIRLHGGIGTFGPVLAAGIGAGFGRDLETYISEHEQTTIKEHYDKNGTIFEKLHTAELENKTEAERMELVKQIPHLKELYDYFKSQKSPLNESQINDLFLGENGLVNELKNNIHNYAVENTTEIGWEVGGGLAAVAGIDIPIPYAYVTFQIPAGTIMRYSIPSDVSANVKVALEDKIQEQLKNQAGTGNNILVLNTRSGEASLNTDGARNWTVTSNRELPDLGLLATDSKNKAEKLTKIYKQYGLTFSEITEQGYENLANSGYLAMELNADFIGDANLEVHVAPSAEGIHLTTLGEGSKNNKIQFAANVNGAKNLIITRREVLKPTGVSDIVITISDKTSTLEEIEAKEPGYYHIQNGRTEYVKGAYFDRNQPAPDKLNLAGKSRKIESRLFSDDIVTKDIIDSSKNINTQLTSTERPNTITSADKKLLDEFVNSLTKKDKAKEFARFSTLKITDFELPNNPKVAQFINREFTSRFPGKKPTAAEFQYLYEQLTEATFVKLTDIGAKQRHIESGINRVDRYIESVINKSPNLANKFTPGEIKDIKDQINADFIAAKTEINFNKIETTNLKAVGLEESYLVSTAANPAVGLENRGFRFVDTNENSTIDLLKNSVTKYSLNSGTEAEKLVARFILELSDPIPKSADFKEAKTLLGSQLAAKLATLPIGKKDGEIINFLPLALGSNLANKVAELIQNPELITGKSPSQEHQNAYIAFYSLVKAMREKQFSGESYPLDIQGESGKMMHIEINLPTNLASLLLERCGNTTFASHQGIEVTVTNEQGKLLGAYAETSPGGYSTTADLDTLNITLGASLEIPSQKGKNPEKEPVPDRPDNPDGGPNTPPPTPEPEKAPTPDRSR